MTKNENDLEALTDGIDSLFRTIYTSKTSGRIYGLSVASITFYYSLSIFRDTEAVEVLSDLVEYIGKTTFL